MFQNTRNYVVQNVLPAYREFFDALRRNRLGQSEVVRTGIAAAVALYHLREHLPNPKPTDSVLEGACPDFALVRDVANVAKHSKLTRGKPKISNASQLFEIGVSTAYEDKRGRYSAFEVAARVKLDDGTERDLAEILHKVMGMWVQKLGDLGITDLPMKQEPLRQDVHLSRAEVAKRRLSGVGIQGEGLALRFEARRFNYATGRSEPIDLTGAKVDFTMRKIPDSAPMHFEIPELGLKADVDIPLTHAQGAKFVRLESAEEKERYVGELVSRSPKLKQRVRDGFQKFITETGWVAPKRTPPT
jgi:hypothetical protein